MQGIAQNGRRQKLISNLEAASDTATGKYKLLRNMTHVNDEKYRRRAVEAQQFADAANSENDKANWLLIAQAWLSLLRGRNPPEETSDEAATSKGRNQKKSNSSRQA